MSNDKNISIKAGSYNEAVSILQEKYHVFQYKYNGVMDDCFTFENCNPLENGELHESWHNSVKETNQIYRSGYIDGATDFRDAAIAKIDQILHRFAGIKVATKQDTFYDWTIVKEIEMQLKNLKANENVTSD